MRNQRIGESRIEYLARVIYEFMDVNPEAAECTVHYDGAVCDGLCLAEDLLGTLNIGFEEG